MPISFSQGSRPLIVRINGYRVINQKPHHNNHNNHTKREISQAQIFWRGIQTKAVSNDKRRATPRNLIARSVGEVLLRGNGMMNVFLQWYSEMLLLQIHKAEQCRGVKKKEKGPRKSPSVRRFLLQQ
jgi:hypothetical protein